MPDTPSCPRCGALVAGTEAAGACPACLLALALDADVTKIGAGYPLDPITDQLPNLPAHYRLESRVGTGGMGVVYRALDTRLNRPVAVKAVQDSRLLDHGAIARFRAEALAAASLDHPYICKVYELIESENKAVLVMEFVEGETLASILRQGRPPLARTIELVSEVAEGLANAHAVGLVHRDIKPSNVMVTPHGHIKLLDFGLAQPEVITDASATTKSRGMDGDAHAGTPHYMSPEQAEGAPITARADIFSLGVLAFECISGELPFVGATEYAYVHSMLEGSPKPLGQLVPGTPKELTRLVERCLSKDPARRPESAAAVARELRQIAATSVAPTAHTIRAASLQRSRNRWVRIAVATVLVAAVAVAVVYQLRRPPRSAGDLRQESFVTWPSEEWNSRSSPDGRWVSFFSTRDGGTALFAQAIDDVEAKVVTLPAGQVRSQIWSPDGTQFALAMSRPEGVFVEIVSAPSGGTAIRSYEVANPLNLRLLRWAGNAIYLQTEAPRDKPGSGQSIALRRLDLTAGQITDVSPRGAAGLPAGLFRDFDVSADGLRLAFTFQVDRKTDLWATKFDGTELVRLTDDDLMERRPIWNSPETVIYQSNKGGQLDLWEVSIVDRTSVNLVSSPTQEMPESASADGSLITFQQVFENADLWVRKPEGDSVQLNADASNDFSVTASADGRTVVFQRSRPTAQEPLALLDTQIMRATLSDGSLTVDPKEVAQGFAARLSPDGGRLAYLQRSPVQRGSASLTVKDLRTGTDATVSKRCLPPGLNFTPNEWTSQNLVWMPGTEDLLFVEKLESEGFGIRRYRPGTGLDADEIVRAAADDLIRDIYPSTDGRTLAYLMWVASKGDLELHVIDLQSGADRVLMRVPSTREFQGASVSLKGWMDTDRSLAGRHPGSRCCTEAH